MTISKVKPPGWAIGEKLTSAQLNQIDIDHTRALDRTSAGDTIAGEVLIGGNSSTATFSGGADITISGVGSEFITGFDGPLTMGDNDVPQYSATRPATRIAPCLVQQGQTFHWNVGEGQSIATVVAGLVGTVDITKYLIDGATFASIDIFMAVGVAHAGVPTMPSFTIIQRAIATGTTTSWSGSFPTPGSGPAWFDGGAIQTINITVGVTIDLTANTYHVVINDESGANAQTGNVYLPFRLNLTGIADTRLA